MTRLERVARAICVATGQNPDEHAKHSRKLRWTFFIPQAQAAIDAMGDGWCANCERLQSEIAEVYALLPGYHYMDPPDGGDVSPLEQMRRMAEDAEKWREHCGHSNQPLSVIEI